MKAAIERERNEIATHQKLLLEDAARVVSPVSVGVEDSAVTAGGLCAMEMLEKSAAQVAGGESALDIFKDDFDSGADSEIEYGSQVTVMSELE